MRSELWWKKQYENLGALWIHDGNPKRPHALLTSGRHSNGFFNSRLVIQEDALLREAAKDLLCRFYNDGGNFNDIDRVVGPQTGATRLAELIAEEVGHYRRRSCVWASPEKRVSPGGKKSMAFNDPLRTVLSGERIFLCEDVLTTGGSIELTARAVHENGGEVLPCVLTLVNRSGMSEIDGRKITSLIGTHMPTWDTTECPLCKEESEAVRPKDNWEKLTVTY